MLQKGQKDSFLLLKNSGITFLINQSLRKLVTRGLALKMPRSKMPLGRLAHKLGGGAQEAEKLMAMMGM